MPRTPPSDGKTFKRPYLSDGDEWPDLSIPPVERERGEEAEFTRTKNYGFVALAIGHWASGRSFPNSPPPQWAIDACLALRECVSMSISPVIEAKEGPKVSADDNRLLEEIAEILLNKGVREKLGLRHSARAAIRFVLHLEEKDDDDENYRRLARHWKTEKDHRLKRAARRTYERLKQRGVIKV